jgi:hypothetical protein
LWCDFERPIIFARLSSETGFRRRIATLQSGMRIGLVGRLRDRKIRHRDDRRTGDAQNENFSEFHSFYCSMRATC